MGAHCFSCKTSHQNYQIVQEIVGSSKGTTFPTKIGYVVCNALVYTGASRSCISENFYRQLNLPPFSSPM